MRRLRGLIAGLVALFGSCWTPQPLHAQVAKQLAPRYVQVEWAPAVRDSLARAWDDTNPAQLERGLCLAYVAGWGERASLIYRITGFVKPDTVWLATQYQMGWNCPAHTLMLHTHTPSTCEKEREHVNVKSCVLGGVDAWECGPSPEDVMLLRDAQQSMAVIQCDRHALIVYFQGSMPHD